MPLHVNRKAPVTVSCHLSGGLALEYKMQSREPCQSLQQRLSWQALRIEQAIAAYADKDAQNRLLWWDKTCLACT